MNRKRVLFYVLLAIFLEPSYSQQVPLSEQLAAKRIMLPNGWALTPVGRSLPLGDLPLNIAESSSGKWLAVTNNGQGTQSLQLVDTKNEKILDSITIPKSWLGLKFSKDERFLYASGGNDNWILKYAIRKNKLILSDTFKLGEKWPVKISPTGLDIDDAKQLLYVVTKENSALYIVDLKTKKIIGQYSLAGEGYTCLLSNDQKELYISCWGCDQLLIFDTQRRQLIRSIQTGSHPNDLCLTKDGHYLFIANANDNSVTVIDLVKRKVLETLNAALFPDAPNGSTTNALALSADSKTLYVANADNNCLTVFDVSHPGSSQSKGFIPVGWYPCAVKVVGKKVFVANGKGFSSMANPFGPNPVNKKQNVAYQKSHTKKNVPV